MDGILGLVISAIALVVAVVALIFAVSAGKRADFRERLMWMQTLRNVLRDMTDEPEEQAAYEDRRTWTRTCLSVSKAYGRREELPTVAKIADRPFKEPWPERIELRNSARREVDRALEREADRGPQRGLISRLDH